MVFYILGSGEKIKKKDIKKLTDFNGNIFLIKRIKSYTYKELKKYIFMIENNETFFKSNYYFEVVIEKIIKNLNIDISNLNEKLKNKEVLINFDIGVV